MRRHLRNWCWSLIPGAALVLSACGWDGNLTFFGYTTAPNYDCNIRTVHVPIFQNTTFRRQIEFDLTRAVIREIEAKTPYKVVSCADNADTELLGRVVTWRRNLVNQNQLGEIREGEAALGVELVWRDLRPGRVGTILSLPKQKEKEPLVPGELVPAQPPPILIQATGNFIPELGGSLTTAEKLIIDRLAVQIVSQMEVWPAAPMPVLP